MAAVVSALELGDFGFSAETAGQTDGVKGGLGARVDEAHRVYRSHPPTHFLGDLGLDTHRRSHSEASNHLRLHGFHHPGVIVPQYLCSVMVGKIHVSMAVQIVEVASLGPLHPEPDREDRNRRP